MNIQIYQLILASIYLALAFGAYKANKVWLKATLVALILIIFFMNPMRFKQVNISGLERPINRFDDIPEKVIIDKPPFDERQNVEMEKFNTNYEESRDEIHN